MLPLRRLTTSLIQEEGIAKGIRRITGVTRGAAAAATATADAFAAKISAAQVKPTL
jgi:alanyl-tRNA synthetase